MFAWARREGLPLAWVLAGGYTPDVSKVVGVHLGTFDAARGRAWRGAAMNGVNRLLAVWTGVVLLFFYLPIAILIVFSFNESRLNIVWGASRSTGTRRCGATACWCARCRTA